MIFFRFRIAFAVPYTYIPFWRDHDLSFQVQVIISLSIRKVANNRWVLRQLICSWSRVLKATKPWFEVKPHDVLNHTIPPSPHRPFRLLWLSWLLFMYQQCQETSTKFASAQPWYECSLDCSPFSMSCFFGRLGASLEKHNYKHISHLRRSCTHEYERVAFSLSDTRWH